MEAGLLTDHPQEIKCEWLEKSLKISTSFCYQSYINQNTSEILLPVKIAKVFKKNAVVEGVP